MNAAFGIDHPLIAVNDIQELRRRLLSIGFNMTAIGKHPWGTSTSLAMFNGCLLEIMGIYDHSLLDEMPAGDFRFGRHVYDHLQNREGVALTALHSTDSARDAARAADAGFLAQGQLEFGRDVVLPDGRHDRTKTTLTLMPDPDWPRLSFFLCQQHRPELIYVPAWLEHPNSAYGIAGITIFAEASDQPALSSKLSALYGPARSVPEGSVFPTANGDIHLLSQSAIEAAYGPLPRDIAASGEPCIVAMDVKYSDVVALETWLKKGGVQYTLRDGAVILANPHLTGNTFFKFVKGDVTKRPAARLE